ncbi:MAG: glycosyltransferase family 2 protein [Polyangiaceae bacterium]|nr:glycosyltransferase family 2 protein [Polyangiaceae bacterium]
MASPRFSFVIPFVNEEATLGELHRRIAESVATVLGTGESYEVIFVDDGSIDGSVDAVEALVESHAEVSLVELQGNFGKSAALAAGFAEARGKIVFTLDADLQDDPKEIPRFLAELERGYDLVSGFKRTRHDPWHKVFPSRIFNWMVRTSTGIRLHDVNCGFKAYRRRVLENVRVYGELHRFVPVLAHWRRFRVGEIEVEHHPRRHGTSKFGGWRFFRGLMDLMTVTFLLRYERRPLHFFGALGGACLALGVGTGVYLTTVWLGGESIGQRPLLILSVLLMVIGVQILATGLIAELVVHLARNERPYVVRRRLGGADAREAPPLLPDHLFEGGRGGEAIGASTEGVRISRLQTGSDRRDEGTEA